MIYKKPNTDGAKCHFRPSYENYIGGKWVPPVKGDYFENRTPVTNELICRIPQSSTEDIELALDAAHATAPKWGLTSVQERAKCLLNIAQVIDDHLEMLAVAESWENGKPVRETLAADLPLAVDHFRYFAGCIRAQEGSASQLDAHTNSYHLYEPLGVVGQIIPWNFPLLMAAWKLAPALAAGNCVVLKPAEQTPSTILLLMELIEGILPPGVINVVNGYGEEAGAALANSERIAKLAFTGSTTVGHSVLSAAAKRLIPSTVELGGKSPNIFFADIVDHEPEYLDKCIEGAVLGFLNQGEVCTCPSRLLVQETIYETLMERILERTANIRQGNPLDSETMLGAQVSDEQFQRILRYLDIGTKEGAEVLCGGKKTAMIGELEGGFYIEPTFLKGDNQMQVFREEIFGPVICVTTFKDENEALSIANDTDYGLGAGVWTRDINRIQRCASNIDAGRIWVNSYHSYPAHAAFGGYKKSGIGRETYKHTLENYQQVKNVLLSSDINALGFF